MAKRKMRKFEEGGDVDPLEAANASKEAQDIAGEAIMKGMRDAEATPRKAPMVTKEELAASGLSLRDYLNKQQGLTRRGESAPRAMPKETTVEKTVVKTEPAAPKARPNENYSNEGRAAPSPSAKKETYRDLSGKTREKSESKRPDFGGAIGRGISDFFGSIRERGRKSNPEAYAKGGSVGSASKRADGIAQRGKTKGKIC